MNRRYIRRGRGKVSSEARGSPFRRAGGQAERRRVSLGRVRGRFFGGRKRRKRRAGGLHFRLAVQGALMPSQLGNVLLYGEVLRLRGRRVRSKAKFFGL